MTNICGLLCILTRKYGKTVQVQRQDDKTLDFTAPIQVEELPGTAAGVGLSNNSHHHLPLTYKLKLGKMYHLLPPEAEAEANDEASSKSKRRRIKVVITKQQLQQLVSSQISVQDVLIMLQNYHQYSRPDLQSIPEGDESTI